MLIIVHFCLVISSSYLHVYCLSINECLILGGEIDSVDKDGNTPLHVAARYGHELLINTLITSGADCTRFVCPDVEKCIFNCWNEDALYLTEGSFLS